MVDLPTAGSVLGIGRTKCYQLAADGQFPASVLRLGNRYRVPTAELLRLVGVTRDVAREDVPA